MSISFQKGQRNIQLLIDGDKNNTVARTVLGQFISMFDGHYINYISYRKQRDLMIVNCFYKMILQDVKIDKKNLEKYQFSSLVKTGYGVDLNYVLPINSREAVIVLEREIAVLKAFYLFYADLKKIFSNAKDICCIETKIKKVQQLNDDTTMARITTNETIKKNIFNELGVMKEFEKIQVNMILYNSLKDSFKL